jgi:hypothetical protein
MITIYNPTDKMFEVSAPNGSVYTFLDNTCKDVEESVARIAVSQHPQLQIIAGKLTIKEEAAETEDDEIERLEREIDSEPAVDVAMHLQPDGSVQLLQAEDLKILGVSTEGMEYFCSHPGCQNKYTNIAIYKQHMKAHDKNDRREVSAKVAEIKTKKGAKAQNKSYETISTKEHEESDAEGGSEESSSKEESSS